MPVNPGPYCRSPCWCGAAFIVFCLFEDNKVDYEPRPCIYELEYIKQLKHKSRTWLSWNDITCVIAYLMHLFPLRSQQAY